MKRTRKEALALGALTVFLLSALPLIAQDTPIGPAGTQVATHATPSAATNSEELRKAAQNPIATLVSVPFESDLNLGIGKANRRQYVLDIQPVIPFSAGKNLNLITRWITPVIYQPLPVPQSPGSPEQQTGVSGLGDLNPSFFLGPKTGKVTWGAGPTFVFPTATNTAYLGQGKLSIGPTVVALVQPPHFTIGILTNNYWSVAGHSDRNKPAVNQFLLEYFVNYNMKKGWYLLTAPIMTANWRAASGSVWTVPLGAGVGRIMKLGFQPVNLNLQFYGNVATPTGGSSWAMKVDVALLFPKLSKEEEKGLLEERLKQMDQQPPQKK
jgi:hypothetical protein